MFIFGTIYMIKLENIKSQLQFSGESSPFLIYYPLDALLSLTYQYFIWNTHKSL